MSYLRLRISILHATMQINNRAPSPELFLIVNMSVSVCVRVCGLVRLFCLPARLFSRRRGFRIKVAVSLPPASSMSLSFSLARARALSRLLNARHMLLHLRDEQLESGAQTEIKPLLLLLSNSETCSLLSRECEGSLPPFWLRRLSPGEKKSGLYFQHNARCVFLNCLSLGTSK